MPSASNPETAARLVESMLRINLFPDRRVRVDEVADGHGGPVSCPRSNSRRTLHRTPRTLGQRGSDHARHCLLSGPGRHDEAEERPGFISFADAIRRAPRAPDGATEPVRAVNSPRQHHRPARGTDLAAQPAHFGRRAGTCNLRRVNSAGE